MPKKIDYIPFRYTREDLTKEGWTDEQIVDYLKWFHQIEFGKPVEDPPPTPPPPPGNG